MGQYEIYEFCKKNANKKFTNKELKKKFDINNISALTAKLVKSKMLKREQQILRKGKSVYLFWYGES